MFLGAQQMNMVLMCCPLRIYQLFAFALQSILTLIQATQRQSRQVASKLYKSIISSVKGSNYYRNVSVKS